MFHSFKFLPLPFVLCTPEGLGFGSSSLTAEFPLFCWSSEQGHHQMFDQRTRARFPLQGCTTADVLPIQESRKPLGKSPCLQSCRCTQCHGLSFGFAGGKAGQGQREEISSMMRALPRKVFSQEEEPGDDLQLSQDRAVRVPRHLDTSQAMHSAHAVLLQGLGLLHVPALPGPGLGRVLEHAGQGERSTHRAGFWALVALPPAAPQGGAAPALLAAAHQQHLFLGYFCSQFIPCLLELL